MATLKDVAERAGISVSTASYVLNGKKKVRRETMDRIFRAAADVGYIPNQTARGLRTKRSGSIGIIVPDISNEFFPEIVRGVEDFFHEQGYSMILCNSDNDLAKEQKYVHTLISKDIDGIIFIGTCKDQYLPQVAADLPLVVVDRASTSGQGLGLVTTDNHRGGLLATEHLIQCGYHSIGVLAGPLYSKAFYDRLSGYMNALRLHGLPYEESLVLECEVTDTSHGYEAAQRLLRAGRADCVFSMNDLMALGAIRAMWENGISVPQDMAVMGFDDISFASIAIPALSTVRQPKYEMGWEAAALLMECIRDPARRSSHIELEPVLVVRETTCKKRSVSHD